jgi:hypothetical protein
MLKETDVEAALTNCRALINQINARLSAEEPFVDVSSAAELLFYLECAASPCHARESVERRRPPSIITDGATPANPQQTLRHLDSIDNYAIRTHGWLMRVRKAEALISPAAGGVRSPARSARALPPSS